MIQSLFAASLIDKQGDIVRDQLCCVQRGGFQYNGKLVFRRLSFGVLPVVRRSQSFSFRLAVPHVQRPVGDSCFSLELIPAHFRAASCDVPRLLCFLLSRLSFMSMPQPPDLIQASNNKTTSLTPGRMLDNGPAPGRTSLMDRQAPTDAGRNVAGTGQSPVRNP